MTFSSDVHSCMNTFTEYLSNYNNLQGISEPPVSFGDLGVYKMSLQFGVFGTFTLMQQLVGYICHLFCTDTHSYLFSDSKGT